MTIKKNKTAKKRKYLIIIILFLTIFASIVYATTNSYRINSEDTIIIDEHGICKKITRTATGDLFIPTKTSTEWSIFRNNAVGVLFADCANSPSQITGLSAIAGNAKVSLSWLAPLNGGSIITNYNIYRGTVSGGETLHTTVGNILSYTDTGLTNNVRYYYQISAVNAIGESVLSSEINAKPYVWGISGVCSGIEIYASDLNGWYRWKTSATNCNRPQCGQDGGQNGDNLVADNTVDFSQYPARNGCKSIGGRLPTRDELLCIYNKRSSLGSFTNDVPAMYWSSTESNEYYAWSYGFNGGYWIDGFKYVRDYYHVRCVRDL